MGKKTRAFSNKTVLSIGKLEVLQALRLSAREYYVGGLFRLLRSSLRLRSHETLACQPPGKSPARIVWYAYFLARRPPRKLPVRGP